MAKRCGWRMEDYISLSFLNDFIFCPRSIYFHQLYGQYDTALYHQRPQISGRAAHQSIDHGSYSTRKEILQGVSVYSETYRLYGKIDLYNKRSATLTERKKRIHTIYDGYIFQLYGQYYGLVEMGYVVKQLQLYSLDTNQSFPIASPEEDKAKKEAFEQLIKQIRSFQLHHPFTPNPNKCARCIYSNLCDKAIC